MKQHVGHQQKTALKCADYCSNTLWQQFVHTPPGVVETNCSLRQREPHQGKCSRSILDTS